ncbi:MAG TPA: hypothetical protein PKD05_10685 [Candidatus Melainabacteria bacterium]|nr:hypothetical protein [Candidatus Melainabacteria bacterium]
MSHRLLSRLAESSGRLDTTLIRVSISLRISSSSIAARGIQCNILFSEEGKGTDVIVG